MSSPSTISITYDGDFNTGVDITDYVLFQTARFECQSHATPGSCSFIVKDETRTLSFEVGKEVYLFADGIKLFGGIVMRVGRQLAFPVDDTTDVSSVLTRQWAIECLDFNVWFDKRVIRWPLDYLARDLGETVPLMDGEFIRDRMDGYIDLPPDVNVTDFVEDITKLRGVYNDDLDTSTTQGRWGVPQQGSKWRVLMDMLASYSAANYYIDYDKNLHFEALSSSVSPWTFVDHSPNGVNTVGCREVSATQDGSFIVNDALVWGGLEAEGSIYFARYEDDESQGEIGRWQLGEDHFNEGMDQSAVTARAHALIDGPPGTQANAGETGLRFPIWRVRLTWFAHEVPRVAEVPQHIRPGQLANIVLYVMGDDGRPLSLFLPLISMSVTFPQVAGGSEAWTRFDGEFGLTYADSRFLWQFILRRQKANVSFIVGSVSNTSGSTGSGSGLGDFATLVPNEAPNGSRTVFTFPVPMLEASIEVFVNGLLWRRYREYDIVDGTTISFYTPLFSDDQMYVEARTAAS